MKYEWLKVAQTMQSIAQAGLTYARDKYDLERYQQIRDLSCQIVADFTDADLEQITGLFANEGGYQTPKVDVRGVIVEDERILLVQETADHCWSLPGGWAEINLSASENTVKEIWEEAGLIARPVRLLAILDRARHGHPVFPYSVYRIFILCEKTGGELKTGLETLDVGYFALDQLPPLSIDRISRDQLVRLMELVKNPELPIWLD